MSTNDAGERGRAEPIDVDFEPAERHYHQGGSNGIGFGSALVLAVMAAGAGAAGGALAPRVPEIRSVLDKTIPDHGPSQSASAPMSEAAIEARVHAIEAIMNTPFGDAANASADGSNLTSRVFALQGGLRDVQTRLNGLPSTDEVRSLVTEVQKLEQDLPAVAEQARTAVQASRAAFAVAAAAEASQKSGPFEQSYASLVALLPNDPEVVALAPLARVGAPTHAELRDSFDRIDTDILRAARRAQAGSGFWGRLQAFLADFIIVQQNGQGDTPDGVVERANARLNADDLPGAVQEVNRLSGPAKDAAARWLADARRRIEIDAHLSVIRTELSRGA